MSALPDYERLGAFYLGRRWDPAVSKVTAEPYLYDSKDLTTHAVCVGMTGSGKTGLCVSLLEEAALDGVPAIAIDPKGDLGNLLLTFPELAAEDFRPWVDEGEARRQGLEPGPYARQVAERWRQGLASWDQDGSRIARLREAADFAIYTPGSRAGLPVTVLRSFSVPPPAVLEDRESLAERVQAATAGLLALVGIEADPITSREHILIANLLERAWRDGRGLDLPALIRAVQAPPFDKLGVLDLESFFPASARFELAMRINSILASPSFATWLEGDPLDVGRLLYAADGRPRLSVVSIAHLTDSERMFFVTLLLNEMLSWTRSQAGSSSLRALLYMDEIFGFFPPVGEPPSKRPMLTLLKQARAFGVGVVLATQNPVDLDYKGLANTGTWFIGRLQTERDKARVLDGLEGASASAGAGFDRAGMERTLAGLGSRVFLAHNVHEDAPLLFHTRWAMSYLRGPLTRSQIATLMEPRKAQSGATVDAAGAGAAVALSQSSPSRTAAAGSSPPPAGAETGDRTRPPADVPERWLAPAAARGDEHRLVWRPVLFAVARLHFVRASLDLDAWLDVRRVADVPEAGGEPEWRQLASEAELVATEPLAAGEYAGLEAPALRSRSYAGWRRRLEDHLYRQERIALWRCERLDAVSVPGEEEGAFRGRLALRGREKRDLEVEKLRARYAKRLGTLEDRVRRAEEKVRAETAQVGQQKLDTVIQFGATLAGALFGRKLASVSNVTRTRSSLRGIGRISKERDDVARAVRELETLRDRLAEMEQELQAAIDGVERGLDPAALELESVAVPPRKSDVEVSEIGLAWVPWRVDSLGIAEPLASRSWNDDSRT
ncbi:MAG: DUF87 domain-containing protein [Thermoanaerobaculia bacterium]|nr:DUF87 domain-containing protein [Thermoanaerobaculia bacterium]